MRCQLMTITPDGTTTVTPIVTTPTLDDLQKAVGGYIQLVPFLETYTHADGSTVRCVAFCNEDGKNDGLPYNRLATAAWARGVAPRVLRDVLVGPVAIVLGDDALLDAL